MIEVKNVSVGYENKIVLQDIHMKFQPGEITVLVGPNGCGKSTLLSIISELILPSEGIISKNKSIKTGYMFQKDHLFEHRTVLSNACIGLEIQKNLNSLQGITKIIIGHRISAVRHADEIIYLKEGKIAERGTHEELLLKRGLYYQTYQAQYGGDIYGS